MNRLIRKFYLLIFLGGVCLSSANAEPLDFILTQFAQASFHWQCQAPQIVALNKRQSIRWMQLSCSGKYPYTVLNKAGKPTGDLKINIIDANLGDSHLYLQPVLARTIDHEIPYRESLLSMGQRHANFIAGINGGYFFVSNPEDRGRADVNCIEKKYPQYSVAGIGDGLLVINGQPLATNCSARLFSSLGRSSLIENKQGQWSIQQVPGNITPQNTENALGAGPGLIQTIQGQAKIHITWEGISSTFEFSANSAVILAQDNHHQVHVIFFTVDGLDKKQGMYATQMANFIKTMLPALLKLNLIAAMSLDQGGSTGLYVRDARPQLVAHSTKSNSPRPIFDALFIGEKS